MYQGVQITTINALRKVMAKVSTNGGLVNGCMYTTPVSGVW